MDYVVAGFGIGAILALIGFALWEFFGTVEEPGKGWLSRAAIGLMLGSLVIWAVTGVSLISHIEDSMGTQLVLLTTLVTLLSIVIGSFWYWRADRALAAANPRPARSPAQREMAVVAPPVAQQDFELTEWDDWPERDAGDASALDREIDEPAPPVSFEPEVAVEAPNAAEVEPEVIEPEGDEARPAAVVPEAPPAAVEPSEEAETEAHPAPALPANVRPFRLPARVEPTQPDVVEDRLIAEAVDADVVEVAAEAEAEAPAGIVDDPRADADVKIEQPEPWVPEEAEPGPPVADESHARPSGFESSLLADVDGSLADDEGGYRSPLLADLGSDKLQGVGLAKWRQDAPLVDDDEADAPPPKRRRRR